MCVNSTNDRKWNSSFWSHNQDIVFGNKFEKMFKQKINTIEIFSGKTIRIAPSSHSTYCWCLRTHSIRAKLYRNVKRLRSDAACTKIRIRKLCVCVCNAFAISDGERCDCMHQYLWQMKSEPHWRDSTFFFLVLPHSFHYSTQSTRNNTHFIAARALTHIHTVESFRTEAVVWWSETKYKKKSTTINSFTFEILCGEQWRQSKLISFKF